MQAPTPAPGARDGEVDEAAAEEAAELTVRARSLARGQLKCCVWQPRARRLRLLQLTQGVPWDQVLRGELERLRAHTAVLERRLAALEPGVSPGKRAREEVPLEAPPLAQFLDHVRVYLQRCTRGERLAIAASGLHAELSEAKEALESSAPLATRARTEAVAAAEAAATGERRTSTLMRSRELEARQARDAAARLGALARDVGGASANSSEVDLSAAEAELSTASAMWAPYAAAAGAVAAEVGRLDDACGRLRDACDAGLDAADDAGRALAALAARRTAVALHLESAQDKAVLAFASADLTSHQEGQQAAPHTPADAPLWAPAPPGRRKVDKPVRSAAQH